MHRFNNKETPRMDILFLSLSLTVLSCTPIGKPQNPYGLPPPLIVAGPLKKEFFAASLINCLSFLISISFYLSFSFSVCFVK